MTTHADLLGLVRKRLDELAASHTASLISAPAASHDRIAGKIEALVAFRKDLSRISREFQVYDADPEEAASAIPENHPGWPARRVQRAAR